MTLSATSARDLLPKLPLVCSLPGWQIESEPRQVQALPEWLQTAALTVNGSWFSLLCPFGLADRPLGTVAVAVAATAATN